MATLDDTFKILEANNRANELIENVLGSNDVQKIMAQIQAMPAMMTPAMRAVSSLPPSVIEFQNNLARIRGLMGNSLPIFENTMPLYESIMPALAYLQSSQPDLYAQVSTILSKEFSEEEPARPVPRHHRRKVNTRRAHELILKSKVAAQKVYSGWAALPESRFGTIMFALDKLVSAVDEPLRSQLNLLLFLVVILFIDTHAAQEGPGKNS